MSKRLITAAIVAASILAPAAAMAAGKSSTECTSEWKSMAGANGTSLTQAQITQNKSQLPSSLQNKTSVTQQEFLSACESGT